MNVKVIFVTLILASVLAISGLSANPAFAKVNVDDLKKLVDNLVKTVDDILLSIDTLRIDVSTETDDRTNADIDLQAQIDDLRILYQSETEAATTATISPYYSNTIIFTTAPSTRYAETISCEDGDIAISSNLVKLENPLRFIQEYSFQPNDNSFTFLFVNTHPTKSLDVELSVTCLRGVE